MVELCSEHVNVIPGELKEYPQWVVWQYEPGDKKPRKVPYPPKNPQYRASTTNPEHWASLEEALEVAAGFNGIGFVFSANDRFCGIDLDQCRDETTGDIAPWATALLHAFPGYAEVSPSGKGIKCIGKGTLPSAKKRKHLVVTDSVDGLKWG
jgi:primase-polymerase (primpol)-like protein